MTSTPRPDKLIVGTDLTTADRHTADVALVLAAALDAPLWLVHALDTGSEDEPPRGEPTSAFHAALEARVAQRTARAQSELDAERARLSGVTRTSDAEIRALLVDGRPWEALTRLAAENERAWLVVGSRRARALLGRTSDHVLRHATTPVLVVADTTLDAVGGEVLVAVDGSELSAHALRAATTLAEALGQRVAVFHARAIADIDARERVVGQMKALAPEVTSDLRVHVGIVESSVAKAIADHARSIGASFVVLGSHGRHGLARMILGSTAQSLAHASPVPVLVVH